ncbi:cytochrome P450 [Kitasatospora sp. NPDC054939]
MSTSAAVRTTNGPAAGRRRSGRRRTAQRASGQPAEPSTGTAARPGRPTGPAVDRPAPAAPPRPAPPLLPPSAPGALPGLGHAAALLRDPLGFLGSLARYGGVVRIRLGPRTVCVVTDAALVHTLLVALAHDCPRGAVQDTLRTAFGDGLLMSEGRAHRDRRRTVQPAFGADRMADYLAAMHRATEERISRWRPGQVLDVAKEMNHLALEIVTRALFDARLSEASTLAFHRALPDLVKGQIVQSLYPHPALARLPLAVNRRFGAAVRVLNRVVDQAVGRPAPVADPSAPGTGDRSDRSDRSDRPTLPELLRAAVDPATGRPLTEADVRSEAITMFGAGTETVSTTLTWLIDELLRHPRIEARVLAELDEHLPAGTVPTPEALARLTYTRSVTQEVVRLHAPNAFLMRTASREVRLGPYLVPAGTELLYSLTALHRDPALHPDPLRFDPERFGPTGSGHASGSPARHAFLPFGAGKHKCIGEAFAWAELTVAAAAILRHWRPVAVPGAAAREVVWTTVQAQGLRVRLAPRTADRPPLEPAAPADAARSAQRRPADGPDRHASWVLGHGLLTAPAELARYQSEALPELIRGSFPTAHGDELDLLVDLLGWFTILDDRFDGPAGRDLAEARAVVDPLLAVLRPNAPARQADGPGAEPTDRPTTKPADRPTSVRTHEPTGTPTDAPTAGLLGAWEELWQRQCGPMSTDWRRRASRDWQSCLDTFVAEAAHRARGTAPDLAETVRLRRHASCLYPFLNILERVHGSEAPARLHADPELHRLRAHTADAATLLNDLYSLAREERQSALPFNTVLALQHAHGYGRERAIAAVRSRVRRLEEESGAIRRRLVRRHPSAHWYLAGTRQLVEGVRAWCGTTSRYQVN